MTAVDLSRRSYAAVPAVVYIVRSGEGDVLYVGVTRNLRARMAGHKVRSSWWSPTIAVTEEHFDRRGDADRREGELIRLLKPPYNSPRRLVAAVSEDLYDQVSGAAEADGESMTAFVTEAITRELRRRRLAQARREAPA